MASDLDKLQGTWRLTSLEVNGQPAAAAGLTGGTIVVSGRTFKSMMTGATYEGTLRLSGARAPKAFDLLFTSGPQRGTKNPGIYKLKGDTWTICLAMQGTKRPKTFTTTPESGLALETLQREGTAAPTPAAKKTSKSAVSATDSPTPTTASGPPTEIEGEWKMASGVFNGVPLDAAMAAFCTRVTRGDVTAVMAGPQVMMRAQFTLDPTKTPRQIDYVNLTGSHKGKKQVGIYEHDGDRLKISIAAPGKSRPKDFSTAKGDGRNVTAWVLTRS